MRIAIMSKQLFRTSVIIFFCNETTIIFQSMLSFTVKSHPALSLKTIEKVGKLCNILLIVFILLVILNNSRKLWKSQYTTSLEVVGLPVQTHLNLFDDNHTDIQQSVHQDA